MGFLATNSGSVRSINARHCATLGDGAQHKAGVSPSLSTTSTDAPFFNSSLVTSTSPLRAEMCRGLQHGLVFVISNYRMKRTIRSDYVLFSLLSMLMAC